MPCYYNAVLIEDVCVVSACAFACVCVDVSNPTPLAAWDSQRDLSDRTANNE